MLCTRLCKEHQQPLAVSGQISTRHLSPHHTPRRRVQATSSSWKCRTQQPQPARHQSPQARPRCPLHCDGPDGRKNRAIARNTKHNLTMCNLCRFCPKTLNSAKSARAAAAKNACGEGLPEGCEAADSDCLEAFPAVRNWHVLFLLGDDFHAQLRLVTPPVKGCQN